MGLSKILAELAQHGQTMTTLMINAVSVKEGGPLVVLRELLGQMVRMRPKWRIHIAAHSRAASHLENTSAKIHTFPNVESSVVKTRLWYEYQLFNLLRHSCADLLFSHTNYLPTRTVPCKTLLLQQHAGHFSDEFESRLLATLPLKGRIAWWNKQRWVRRSIRQADVVTVQTKALAQAILQDTQISAKRITVIAHGPGQTALVKSQNERSSPEFLLGYTTKFGVQKNFDVVLRALAELKRRNVQVALALTLDTNDINNQRVLSLAKQLRVENMVRNHGELQSTELAELYSSLDAFVFPTLCESFGFPLVEAMSYGLPVIVADVPSSREIACNAAIPFPPHDPKSLADCIVRLMKDRNWFEERSMLARRRSIDFSWEEASMQTIELIESILTN